MKTTTRAARAKLRTATRETRAARRAAKAVATGAPQTARVLLVAAGLADTDARRYASAFSRGVTATDTVTVARKLKGRRVAQVPAKVYDLDTFRARLATYRPKNPTIAARFAALAA